MNDAQYAESQIDMYEDCQKLQQSIESINKEFKSYKEFCNYVQNNAYTIERENSDHEINIFDVYSESSNGSVFNYESDSGDSTDENSK